MNKLSDATLLREFDEAAAEYEATGLARDGIVDALRLYLADRVDPGLFLKSILAHDLAGAILHMPGGRQGLADWNGHVFEAILSFIDDAIPMIALGPDVDDWIHGVEDNADQWPPVTVVQIQSGDTLYNETRIPREYPLTQIVVVKLDARAKLGPQLYDVPGAVIDIPMNDDHGTLVLDILEEQSV